MNGPGARPRVLHCIYDDPANPWLGGGGAHRVLELYRRLTGELDVTVAAGAFPGSGAWEPEGARSAERDGVVYRFLGRPTPYPVSRWTYARAAGRLMREGLASGEYDAAVFDFSVYTPLRVPADPRVGHVVHMPIGPTAGRRWGALPGRIVAWREQRMLGRARCVQTTSEWMRDRLRPLRPQSRRRGRKPHHHLQRHGQCDHRR